jgi:nickel/cobalt exporter
MQPQRRFAIIALAAGCLLAPAAAQAHLPLYGVGTAWRIVFKEDKILITFDLSYADIWAQGEMISADANKSSAVEEDEAAAYVERQWTQKIAPRIKARLDGADAPIRKATQRHEGLVGEIYGVPFSLYYELEVDVPGGKGAPGATHTFELEDAVVRDETPAKPQFFIPYLGHGSSDAAGFQPDFIEPATSQLDPSTMSHLLVGPRLALKYRFARASGGAASPEAAAQTPAEPAMESAAVERARPAPRPAASDWTIDGMMERYDDASWWEAIVFALLAIIYGAGHALAPGHGKSMVAAYLIGTKGRTRDAVILGTVTTLTHTGSVFLFGLTIFIAVKSSAHFSEGAIRNMILVGAQMFSGMLLLLLGLFLFFKRIQGIPDGHHHAHEHGHGHSHGHAHSHGHHHSHEPIAGGAGEHSHEHSHAPAHDATSAPATAPREAEDQDAAYGEAVPRDPSSRRAFLDGGAPRLRDLLTIGFTGGLVPCPAGLTVILLALHRPEHMLFGLLLLILFSIGLGSVLVAIGVLLISGRALVKPRVLSSPWFRSLPAISALFVAGLGAFFCVATYRTGKQPLAALLRLAASWIE